MASPVSLKRDCGTAPLLLVYSFLFYTPNQKYVGMKEWAIQAISVLSSALPELAQSRLRASSNPVIKPLIISLTGSHLILKNPSARTRFPRSLQAVLLWHSWEIVHLLFGVEGVQPQSQIIHISDWSICLACFWNILGAKIKGSRFLCPRSWEADH